MNLSDLPTPSVLVEEARLMRNIQRMQDRADGNDVALRPHIKTHKSVAIARRQREAGAQGLTVATVDEAEVFVAAGFEDVRLAYTVVGRDKHERLLRLMEQARMSFCVDTVEGAQAAAAVYAAAGRTAEVLVEVDVGYGRCGVPWDGAHSVDLVQTIRALEGLRVVGLLTHAGQSYQGPQAGETAEQALRRVSEAERDRMLAFAGRLREARIPEAAPGRFAISIGSTPSMRYFENREAGGFRITEIRPGNYVFYDAIQIALGAATLADCALTVQATVISKRRDRAGQERFYLDAGKKALTSDTGAGTQGYGILLYNPAAMVAMPHARIVGLSEEHGWGQVAGGATLAVGDRVRIVPNHACVTAHTQDHLYLVEGDTVVDTLAVDARGRKPA